MMLRSRAFTLIELLVVVAILGVLVSVLLPSLAAARRHARATVCQSNLRQLATAAQMYAEGHGVYPPFRLKTFRGATYVNAVGRAKPRWQWFLMDDLEPAIDPRGFELPFGDSSVAADGRSGLEMTSPYFLDPEFTGEFEASIRNGAYGYNYQFLGNSRTDDAGRTLNWPIADTFIRVPSGTILFGDSRGADLAHGKHSYTLDPPIQGRSPTGALMEFGPGSDDGPLPHSPVEMRHSGRGNVAFLDTHVEALELRELGYELDEAGVAVGRAPGPGVEAFATNRLWTGTGSDQGRGG